MLFYYYPKCSTCQKAKKWLETNQIQFQAIDVTKERPTKEQFLEWFKNVESKKFFNTSGLLYREGGYKDRLKEMTEEEKAEILANEGMLIKRPLLINKEGLILGFKEENYQVLLKN